MTHFVHLDLRSALAARVLAFFACMSAYAQTAHPGENFRAEAVRLPRVTWRPVAVVPGDQATEVESVESDRVDVAPVQYASPIEIPFTNSSSGDACDQGCHGDECSMATGLWVRGEYLHWSLDGADLPPLVTTSPAGTAPQNTGVLGSAGTDTLFGGDSVNDGYRPGGRISIGFWESPIQCVGYEASYLGIARDDENFRAGSSSTPLLARPVFDTGLAAEVSMLVAHPDFLTGSIAVKNSSELQSFDLLRRQMLSASACHRLDLLFGYRHGRLDEFVRVDQSSRYTAPQGQIITGTTVELFDRFETENRFNGAQIGLNLQQHNACWTLDSIAKIAVGLNRTEVKIDGLTTNTVPGGGSATFAGGLLAQTTNIGDFELSDFIVVPEVGITLRGRLNRCTEVSLGYGAMYWSQVARAADQIDRRVSQFPPEPPSGTRNPEFRFATDGFFTHGLNAGLQFQY